MKTLFTSFSFLALGVVSSQAALAWTVGERGGVPDPNSGQLPLSVPEIANIYATNGTTTFVQEAGSNALPGDPNSPATNQAADDDFYFPGNYVNQVDGGPAYTPIGSVSAAEAGVERAVTSGDLNNRFHFNFDASNTATDIFNVSFGMRDAVFDDNTGTGFFDITILVNGVDLGTTQVSQTGDTGVSAPFTLADVGATAGAPDDNYVELRGSTGGSTARWQNYDYVRLDFEAVPEPTSAGLLGLAFVGFTLLRRRARF